MMSSSKYGGAYGSSQHGSGFAAGSSGDSARASQRLNVLAALTSLAVATRNDKVLQGVAAWMQVTNDNIDSLLMTSVCSVRSVHMV